MNATSNKPTRIVVALFVLLAASPTIAQDLTITNLDQLAQEAFSANHSLYLPSSAPCQWQAYSTYGDEPWWVDCSQVACVDLLSSSTDPCATIQMHGVTVTFATLTKNILTGETLVESGCSTDVITTVAAPSGYDPGAELGPNAWVWREWQQVTNSPDCWGLTNNDIPPPIVIFRTRLADASTYFLYQSNLDAEAEAAAAAGESSGSGFTGGSRFTMMDMDEDSCTITDETSAFFITDIEWTADDCTVTWTSCSDHIYGIFSSDDLSNWVGVTAMWGADDSTSWTDTTTSGVTNRFYKIVRIPPDEGFNGDAIPSSWAVDHGLNPLDPNLDVGDPDGDGYSNLQEYLYGTDPTNSASHPSGQSLVTVYNAYGIYTNSGQIYLRADARSTNATVTVAGAEYFDTTAGTNGSGIAMSALDGTFDGTNETVVATLTPTFSTGERHVFWLHARGSDGLWGTLVQVIINPNINDVLAKIRGNYSQIGDISYTVTRQYYFEGVVANTETVLYRQKGDAKMRWDNLTSGAVTIINGQQMDVIDQNGQLTPLAIFAEDDTGNNPQAMKMTQFFWDMDQFQAQHDLSNVTSSTNGPSSYTFGATPKTGTQLSYDSMTCEVDFRYGAVTQFSLISGGSVALVVEQPQPSEIAPGVWFHSQQNSVIPLNDYWSIRCNELLQTNTVTINTGSLSDSLFQP